jgi:hypothetical protein
MSVAFIYIVILLFIMVLGGFVVGAIHNAYKLLFGVPWLQWLTLDEIVEMGHSRFWAKQFLPVFYRMSYVEIRISDLLSELDRALIGECGFHSYTVMFYEFKFTEKWRRSKKKPKSRAPKFELTPV